MRCAVNPDLKVGCLVAGMIGRMGQVRWPGSAVARGDAQPVWRGSGRRARWGRFCARSPGATCAHRSFPVRD